MVGLRDHGVLHESLNLGVAIWQVRGLLAGGKLALDALVPEQLLLADRGLQPGRGLQQVLHGEQQGRAPGLQA